MLQEIKRIPLEGAHNTRDLGGYRTLDGRLIRPHRLIRSGHLHDLTPKDRQLLTEEYEVRTVVDFRTDTERREKPDAALTGAVYLPNPILAEAALGITREEGTDNSVADLILRQLKKEENAGVRYMESLYAGLVMDAYCVKQYRNFFRILLAQEEGAVLWHCTAGKDRAGTGTVLLLLSLGVSKEQVVADYMKVNEFARENIDRTVEAVAQRTGDASLAGQLRVLFTVHESYIRTVFNAMEESGGSVDGYLERVMGLDAEQRKRLQKQYLQ